MAGQTLNQRVAKYHGTPKGRLTHLLCGARTRAKKWNVPFDIDGPYLLNLYLEQEEKCPVTGWSFDLTTRNGRSNVSPNAMSLDRIESDKGYVKGNVRVISVMANVCRGRWDDDTVLKFCSAVTENNK